MQEISVRALVCGLPPPHEIFVVQQGKGTPYRSLADSDCFGHLRMREDAINALFYWVIPRLARGIADEVVIAEPYTVINQADNGARYQVHSRKYPLWQGHKLV